MEEIKEDIIKAVVAIIIGLYVLVSFKETLAGIILIAIGVIIIGVNENLRNLALSFLKSVLSSLRGEEQQQKMEKSPRSIQQQAGRDAIVQKIGKIILQKPEKKRKK